MLHYAVNAEHCAKLRLRGVKLQWLRHKDNSVLKTASKGRTRRSGCWNLTAEMRNSERLKNQIGVYLRSADGFFRLRPVVYSVAFFVQPRSDNRAEEKAFKCQKWLFCPVPDEQVETYSVSITHNLVPYWNYLQFQYIFIHISYFHRPQVKFLFMFSSPSVYDSFFSVEHQRYEKNVLVGLCPLLVVSYQRSSK